MLLERAFLGVYPVPHRPERGKPVVAGRGMRQSGILVVGWKERIGRKKKRVGRKIGRTGESVWFLGGGERWVKVGLTDRGIVYVFSVGEWVKSESESKSGR